MRSVCLGVALGPGRQSTTLRCSLRESGSRYCTCILVYTVHVVVERTCICICKVYVYIHVNVLLKCAVLVHVHL